MCFFFFSSRRRHTRCSRDWSSDVCSSDLTTIGRSLSARQRPKAKLPTCISTLNIGSRIWQEFLVRSEEHTSELQSRLHLVCRLLLEKKKPTSTKTSTKTSSRWAPAQLSDS